MIAARSRDITLGDFWKWTSIPESRFPELAELLSAYWLNINGKIQSSALSSGTQYAAYLVFKMATCWGIDGDIVASVRIAGVEICKLIVYIDLEYQQLQQQQQLGEAFSRSSNRRRLLPKGAIAGVEIAPYYLKALLNRQRLLLERGMPDQFPKLRTDGWQELKIGEFFVYSGEGDEVELSVSDARDTKRRNGLIVEGIEIRPAGA